jgi:glycosyltransferase involved in cell wall biosynthesis
MVGVTVLVNAWYLRRPRRVNTSDLQRLSVLIPARNEEENIGRLMTSLESQDYPDLEILLYDDGSEDATAEIIASHSRENVIALRGEGPPEGWIGKVHALYQASRRASGRLYLFLDADIELLHPQALRNLVGLYRGLPGRRVLTGYPRFRGGGFPLVSMVPAAIFGGLPWPLVRRHPSRRLAAMNGQVWMIDADSYHELEPHLEHRNEVLEDVEIGRYLKSRGVIPFMGDLQKDLAVHMYPDLAGAWHGFRKNAYLIMGGSPAAFIPLYAIFVTAYLVAPVIAPWFLVPIYAVKFITDRLTRFPLWVTLLAPVSLVMAGAVHIASAVGFWRGTISWKGRRVGSSAPVQRP